MQSLKSFAPATIVAGAHYFLPSIVSKTTVVAVVVIQVISFLHTLALSPYTAPHNAKKVVDEDEETVEQERFQGDVSHARSVPGFLLYAFGAVGVMLLARMLKMFGMVQFAWWAPFVLGGVVRMVMQSRVKENEDEITAEDDECSEHLNEEWKELEFWQELEQEDQTIEAKAETEDIGKAALAAASVKLGGSTLLYSSFVKKKPLTFSEKTFVDDDEEQKLVTHHSKPNNILLCTGVAALVLLLAHTLKFFGMVRVAWWAPFLLGGIARAIMMLVCQARVVKTEGEHNAVDEDTEELADEWQEYEFWRELDEEGDAANNVKADAKAIAKEALAATSAMISH